MQIYHLTTLTNDLILKQSFSLDEEFSRTKNYVNLIQNKKH